MWLWTHSVKLRCGWLLYVINSLFISRPTAAHSAMITRASSPLYHRWRWWRWLWSCCSPDTRTAQSAAPRRENSTSGVLQRASPTSSSSSSLALSTVCSRQTLTIYYYYYTRLTASFSGQSRHQKDKTSLDVRYDGVLGCNGISWTICKQSTPRSRQITTPTQVFLQAGCFSCRPANSVKALKARKLWQYKINIFTTSRTSV